MEGYCRSPRFRMRILAFALSLAYRRSQPKQAAPAFLASRRTVAAVPRLTASANSKLWWMWSLGLRNRRIGGRRFRFFTWSGLVHPGRIQEYRRNRRGIPLLPR